MARSVQTNNVIKTGELGGAQMRNYAKRQITDKNEKLEAMESSDVTFEGQPELRYIPVENYLKLKGDDPHGANPYGLVLSGNWSIEVNGNSIPVYDVPITHGGPISFTGFSYRGNAEEVKITARSADIIEKAVVLPKKKHMSFTLEDNAVNFSTASTGHFVVEINDDIMCPLFISVNPSETERTQSDNGDVLFFGAGLHKLNFLELHSGQTIYLAEGAILQAIPPDGNEKPAVESDWAGKPVYKELISGVNVEGVTIKGRGIIDASKLDWHARNPVFFKESRNILIEGITIIGSPSWTIHLFKCSNCIIRNVKLFAHRENSDGIDIVNCEHITVEDCLIRTGDDAVCVKSMSKEAATGGKDILVQRCIVWNDKVRCLGIAGETVSNIYDVVFRDCDILHSMATWTRELGSLCIIVGDSGTVNNITFENIRIEDERNNAICCLIFKDRWSKEQKPGQIENIFFHNIQIPKGAASYLGGFDSNHCIKGVSLKEIYVDNNIVTALEDTFVEMNSYVKNIHF